MRLFGLLLFVGLSVAGPASAQEEASARLKDLVLLEGAAPVQLMGYGLVVGLDRTGDRARGQRGAPYTVQSIANMLRRFGINVDPNVLASRNVAAVMVSGTMTAFNGEGSMVDVTVSALGDARSLSGGVLLQTPLLNRSRTRFTRWRKDLCPRAPSWPRASGAVCR
jgi:flagellar P-ring protein precursor FlgI